MNATQHARLMSLAQILSECKLDDAAILYRNFINTLRAYSK